MESVSEEFYQGFSEVRRVLEGLDGAISRLDSCLESAEESLKRAEENGRRADQIILGIYSAQLLSPYTLRHTH